MIFTFYINNKLILFQLKYYIPIKTNINQYITSNPQIIATSEDPSGKTLSKIVINDFDFVKYINCK